MHGSTSSKPTKQPADLNKVKTMSLQVDLWSTGVILYELFTGQPPFFCNNIYDLCKSIMHSEPKYPKTMSPDFKSFLQVCLAKLFPTYPLHDYLPSALDMTVCILACNW